MKRTWIIIFVLVSCSIRVVAHAPDQSYLYLSIFKTSIDGRFEINTKDLSIVLDRNIPTSITKNGLEELKEEIHKYYLQRTEFSSLFGYHDINFSELDLLKAGRQGTFVLINFTLENVNRIPDNLNVYYNVLFDKQSSHRGFLLIENNWKAGIRDNEGLHTLIYTGSTTNQSLDLTDGSVFVGISAMMKEGIRHIWYGFDHILFLFALILPSVISRSRQINLGSTGDLGPLTHYLRLRRLPAVDSFKEAFIFIIKIVTCFTIAHTITLSLAALNIIILPSRLVESIIAISIALAAIHNFAPIFKGNEWIIAFVFGFFHGFGFASVLAEIGMIGEYLGYSLFGFNVGVELGQLAIICVVFPVLFLIRNTTFYQLFFYAGSAVLIFISLYWFTERAFDIDLQLANTLAAILRSFS